MWSGEESLDLIRLSFIQTINVKKERKFQQVTKHESKLGLQDPQFVFIKT